MQRLLRRPWLVTLGALALALGAFIAVNAVDQELRPEVRTYFTRPGVPFSKESGWALITGFNAPAGQEPRSYAEALRKASGTRPFGSQSVGIEAQLDVRAASELLCAPQDTDCIRAFRQRPESIRDLAADNAELLARYDELLRSNRLGDAPEALDYYGSLGYFQTVLKTQVVRLSQIAAAVAAGDTQRAVAWLEADAAFHRRWLEESGSILTKMLSVRSFSRDLLLAGQVARTAPQLSPPEWDALERVAAPLTPAQRGVGPVIRAEAYLFSGVLDRLAAEPRATSRLIDAPRLTSSIVAATHRRNATLNFAYPLFAEWAALDAQPTEALEPAIQAVRARRDAYLAGDWTWAYNYTGKSFAAEAPPDHAEYVYRVRDTDALAALIRCVIALRRSETRAEGAAAFVAQSPACRDPYGGSFAWSPDGGTLSFKPRSPGQVKRFGGSGDRVIFAAYPST